MSRGLLAFLVVGAIGGLLHLYDEVVRYARAQVPPPSSSASVTFPLESTAATGTTPHFTRDGDENSGLAFPGDNDVAIYRNGTAAFRADSSGGITLATAGGGGYVLNTASNAPIYLNTGSGTEKIYQAGGAIVVTGGYLEFESTAAGAPTAGDCDADAERGRLAIDTTNNRLYVCNGGTRLWDYVALTD